MSIDLQAYGNLSQTGYHHSRIEIHPQCVVKDLLGKYLSVPDLFVTCMTCFTLNAEIASLKYTSCLVQNTTRQSCNGQHKLMALLSTIANLCQKQQCAQHVCFS